MLLLLPLQPPPMFTVVPDVVVAVMPAAAAARAIATALWLLLLWSPPPPLVFVALAVPYGRPLPAPPAPPSAPPLLPAVLVLPVDTETGGLKLTSLKWPAAMPPTTNPPTFVLATTPAAPKEAGWRLAAAIGAAKLV